VTTTTAAAGTRRHTGSYPAEPAQVGRARAALAAWLLGSGLAEPGGWPLVDEAVLIASEFAANSVLHSASRDGGAFTLRAEAGPDRLRIEVEDAGGPWRAGAPDDSRPHGFDVVAALAGPGNWGIDGDHRGRTAWARLGRPGQFGR
jgi:anti-sigma regulatory factor (Ser/Thr protein kinase)